jgi:hypothetical protein
MRDVIKIMNIERDCSQIRTILDIQKYCNSIGSNLTKLLGAYLGA